jgi:hypothetical protein
MDTESNETYVDLADENIGSVHSFTMKIDFPTGNIHSGNLSFVTGDLDFDADDTFGATSEPVQWNMSFTGSISGGGTNGRFITLSQTGDGGNLIRNPGGGEDEHDQGGTISGSMAGYWVSSSTRTAGHLALGFTLKALDDVDDYDWALAGSVLVDGSAQEEVEVGDFSKPDPTIESQSISWGSWDNPIEENWVVTNPIAGGQVELQTANHIATLTPTPIANMQGTASYASSAASSFIGSGSAGNVSQVVAGMSVDFDTGLISNGSLQVEVGGSQAWEIDFSGSVNGGLVDLNAIGGTLSDPGGIISQSIDANLGGVFTGNQAEAFVGGFDLIDQINELNQVDGIYTIER